MTNQVELAFGQVIKRIEPLTRFDSTSLQQESDNVRLTTGKAFWQFSPTISNNREEHTNRLPYSVARIDSAGKLDEVAQQTFQAAYQELPRRIQTWLQMNHWTDDKLEPSDCFDGPQVFGYEYKCSRCGGDGWVKCSSCTNGYNDCGTCSTKGYVDCSKCSNFLWSTGKEKCRGCGGSGKKNGNTCATCNGKGKLQCSACHGAKTVTCSKCRGAGKIPCSTCGTTGRLICQPCEGTGHFHILRTVACAVHDHFRVDLTDAKQEVVSQLAGRDLNGLRTLASVTQKPPTVRGNVVEREYDLECIITEIGLQVAGRKLELIGFGGRAQIFDFKKIVPVILAGDLLMLKQAVAQTPLRLWGDPTELTTATSQFLDSEVNIRIDDSTLLRDKIVDGAYVRQVKTLLPAALWRILCAHMGLAFLLTALSPTAVFLLWHFTDTQKEIGAGIFIPPVITAVTLWILLERTTRFRLRTLLNDRSGEKVDGQLRKYRILWKARAVVLALTVILLVIAALLPLPLPG